MLIKKTLEGLSKQYLKAYMYNNADLHKGHMRGWFLILDAWVIIISGKNFQKKRSDLHMLHSP